jgi:dTDP-4-amino-4,6-dideoxygalactose transaminase
MGVIFIFIVRDLKRMISMIPFNRPPYVGAEEEYIKKALLSHKLSGDGEYTKRCSRWFEKSLDVKRVLLTTSCTHATEMAVMLAGIGPGDEVIMPSFTFVSTADAVVLRGAKPVFVDIRPDTMNIDEELIENAVNERTKAIIPVHYAGISCEMDKIMDIAAKYRLYVIEDAAQGVMSTYKDKPLGTIGHFGCFSFHETKNVTMGEGGALLLKDFKFIEAAEIIREKGTNRSQFFRGEIDKYTWVEAGSSYLPSELNAAYLWAQLEQIEQITKDRMDSWTTYKETLSSLADRGKIEMPYVPDECGHNAHIFYIKVKNLEERGRLLTYLKNKGISAVFHYVPLHSSPAGRKYGRFAGQDIFTTKESERLIRLPLYYRMGENVYAVAEAVQTFYQEK